MVLLIYGKYTSCLTTYLIRQSYYILYMYIYMCVCVCITCTFYLIHSYLFGLNISLHIGKPYNAFNPCTQAYTNIDNIHHASSLLAPLFHVIHTHGHFKLLNPSSQRPYNHSYEKSHRNTQYYVSLSVESLQSFTWKVSQT
jgi:hypothetical protein